MEHVFFCGVRLARNARPDLLRAEMGTMLAGQAQHMIVTPNPEMLVLAHQESAFRDILNHADLALPDGVGIAIMSRLLRTHPRTPDLAENRPASAATDSAELGVSTDTPRSASSVSLKSGTVSAQKRVLGWVHSPLSRMPGIDFLNDVLFPIAEAEGKSIFFLGAREGVAADAARAATRAFPRLRIAGVASGGHVVPGSSGDWHRPEDTALCATIAATKPDILLVAFGQRKQEFWIARHLNNIPSVRIAIGVGGAFSFLSGRIRRAPRIIRRSGLEWLWRFFREPWRIRRMINAVLVFPCLVCYDFFKRRTGTN